MSTINNRDGKIAGKSIILLSSLPYEEKSKKYNTVQDEYIEVFEAIVSMSRAVLYEKGRILYSGDPVISILIALIAGEYMQPIFAEGFVIDDVEGQHVPPISIFQTEYSDLYSKEIELLQSIGFISLKKEKEPDYTYSKLNPIAAVCIGGNEDVKKSLYTIIEVIPNIPIYTIEKTGGAAADIAKRAEDSQYLKNRIRTIDRDIMYKIDGIRKEFRMDQKSIEDEFKREMIYESIPYASIMQSMINEISHNKFQGLF